MVKILDTYVDHKTESCSVPTHTSDNYSKIFGQSHCFTIVPMSMHSAVCTTFFVG